MTEGPGRTLSSTNCTYKQVSILTMILSYSFISVNCCKGNFHKLFGVPVFSVSNVNKLFYKDGGPG